MPQPLPDLSPLEYEHPFDTQAMDAVSRTPGLDTLVRQFNKLALEKFILIQHTGSSIKLGASQLPDIHALLDQACEIINLPARPDFYLTWNYAVEGFTVGIEHPSLVLTSGAVDLLTPSELLFVIGHELGHIKSRHVLYHQMAQVLPVLGSMVGSATLGIGELLSLPLQYALMAWYRMSEFTADRAGLLACQDRDAALSVMAKLSGVPQSRFDQFDPATFLAQAQEFQRLDYDTLNKLVKFCSILDNSHPWTVMRAAELAAWIDSGDYEAVCRRETTSRAAVVREGGLTFCRSCGYRMVGGEAFCPNCGTAIL